MGKLELIPIIIGRKLIYKEIAMNKELKEILNFEITDDADYMKDLNPMPFELEVQIDNLYKLAMKGKKAGIKRISRLIEKYPKDPTLKNFLSVLYNKMGDSAKSNEVNRIIVEKHPDYLFGRLNLASEYYYAEKHEKMPEVLGDNFNLKELYPEREIFHLDEVIGMFKMAIMYYSAEGDFDAARIRLDFIKEEGFEEDYEKLRILLTQEAMKKRIAEKENEINVEVTPTILTDNVAAPSFQIELIEQLYLNDFQIDNEIIAKLLSTDRELLINDLNKVLSDSIERYKYFSDLATDEGYNDENFTFLLHALFLLGELEASDSLENVFEVLSQDYDFVDFYISDILTEYVWIALYKIVNHKLDDCKEFMQKPGIDTYHKSVVTEAVMQIALHQPQRREEVVNWYRDLFHFFLNSSINDNVIDSGLLGMMVSDVLDFSGKELLPEVEQLFEKQMVDVFACGNFDTVKYEIEKPVSDIDKNEILDIYEIYKNLNSWPRDEDLDDDFDDELFEKSLREIAGVNPPELSTNSNEKEGKKVGRNEPCPCGSGKKYKKCCLNK